MSAGPDVHATIGLDSLPLTPWQGLGVVALWTVGAAPRRSRADIPRRVMPHRQLRGYGTETRAGYLAAVIADSRIAIDDPRNPDVRALLGRHLEFALGQTPPEHSFALDVDGLLDPAITLFSVRVHGNLVGVGAIKRLSPIHAEIKSMHTAEEARGHGIGRAVLTHLLQVARAEGFRRVSLETGTTPAFAAARALYQGAGFVSCGPFGSYQPSEDNLFMTLELDSSGHDRPPGRESPGSRNSRAEKTLS
jgi:putative acetyltransferase